MQPVSGIFPGLLIEKKPKPTKKDFQSLCCPSEEFLFQKVYREDCGLSILKRRV